MLLIAVAVISGWLIRARWVVPNGADLTERMWVLVRFCVVAGVWLRERGRYVVVYLQAPAGDGLCSRGG